MKTYIILAILIVLFLYMVVWTCKYYFFTKRQNKVKRVQELRAKGAEAKRTAKSSPEKPADKIVEPVGDYWYNRREIEDCTEESQKEKYYHYFESVEQGIHELLIEMYDYGLVRMDALEEIAYGENHLENVDLSFLKELEEDMTKDVNDTSEDSESASTDTIIQVQGVMNSSFFGQANAVENAAKQLRQDDPGITDIRGTLSDGVVNVIAAVDEEKAQEDKKNEPIMEKKEKSVEEARKARAMTANSEVRTKIYEKWVLYVSELYDLIEIHAQEDTKVKIKKALMDYGYNDVDVLLQSPE